jgi:transposase
MLDEATILPDDPDDLRGVPERLIAEVKAQAVLTEKLRHQLAGHRAWRYGASSEASGQLQLALETSELAAAAMVARLKLLEDRDTPAEKAEPKRRPIPDHVSRNEIEITLVDGACAGCGGTLRRLGEDVTEELEYVPGRFVVNRITRPRFACSGCDGFTQSPLPSRPIERGRPGPGLLAHVLVSKYADHLPLYRQSQLYAREGIDLDRSTIADGVGRTTTLLAPLAEVIARHVLDTHAIHADDTLVQMLAPGTGKTRTARLWAYVRDERQWGSETPPAALSRFSPDRKGIHPARHLAGFEGWMHADGYAGFEDLYRGGAIREVACMAHVRRKFVRHGSRTDGDHMAHPPSCAGIEHCRGGHRADRQALCRREGDPGITARRAGPHPAGSGRTGLRRPRALAGRAADDDLRQGASRGGDPVCAWPDEAAAAIPRRRSPGAG